jgi:hypothetical protein
MPTKTNKNLPKTTGRRLPKTTGRWAPIIKGKGTSQEKVIGYLELFWAEHCGWVSAPGGRYIDVL